MLCRRRRVQACRFIRGKLFPSFIQKDRNLVAARGIIVMYYTAIFPLIPCHYTRLREVHLVSSRLNACLRASFHIVSPSFSVIAPFVSVGNRRSLDWQLHLYRVSYSALMSRPLHVSETRICSDILICYKVVFR